MPINADTLCALYMRTLDAMLIPPVPPDVNKQQIRALLRACRSRGAATLRPPRKRQTWIWADLHAGHEPSLAFFKRPFRTTHHLDYVLFEAWKQLVRPDDLMLCLGDVIVDSPKPGVIDRIRKMPGRKHLVAGNHEMFWWGRIDLHGFDHGEVALHWPGPPELLFTHIPIPDVPPGCVNVHGHIHNEPSPSRLQHINVGVEQTAYRPVTLEEIAGLANELLQGHDVPGQTTAAKLTQIRDGPYNSQRGLRRRGDR